MTEPTTRTIFVFGSNLAGRHGAGSAKHARLYYSALPGVWNGHTGSAYAIPTKDENLNVLPLNLIHDHVEQFIAFAREHPDWRFELVAIGCGLAGYRPWHIAPMFADAPPNVIKPKEFL